MMLIIKLCYRSSSHVLGVTDSAINNRSPVLTDLASCCVTYRVHLVYSYAHHPNA